MTTTTITTEDQLETFAKSKFVDGLITGVPLGQTVSAILQTASAYGYDEAGRSAHYPAKVSFADFDELRREMTLFAVNAVFAGKLDNMIQTVCRAAAAFGFQNAKALGVSATAE